MRYEPEHKELTRQRIVETGARLFRRDGFRGASVRTVMQESGLTVGGFYAHFEDKETLYRDCFAHSMQETANLINAHVPAERGMDWLRGWIDFYISENHVNAPELGCPLTTLSSEMARENPVAQSVFEECFQSRLEEALSHFKKKEHKQMRPILLATISTAVGAVTLARSMQPGDLRTKVLKAAREAAQANLPA